MSGVGADGSAPSTSKQPEETHTDFHLNIPDDSTESSDASMQHPNFDDFVRNYQEKKDLVPISSPTRSPSPNMELHTLQRHMREFYYHVQREYLGLHVASERKISEAKAGEAMAERRAKTAERCNKELKRNLHQQSIFIANLLREREQMETRQGNLVINNNSADEAAVNTNLDV